MADKVETPVQTEKKTAAASVYTIDECAKNHKQFGASYEIVAVALKLAGKETVTFEEAQRIVNSFMKRKPGKNPKSK